MPSMPKMLCSSSIPVMKPNLVVFQQIPAKVFKSLLPSRFVVDKCSFCSLVGISNKYKLNDQALES